MKGSVNFADDGAGVLDVLRVSGLCFKGGCVVCGIF